MPFINNVNEFNDRIEFVEKKKIGSGPNGQAKYDWVPVFSRWAHIKTRKMNEINDLIGSVLEDTVAVVIRHFIGHEVSMESKVKYNGELYEVVRFNTDVSHKEFDVLYIKKAS